MGVVTSTKEKANSYSNGIPRNTRKDATAIRNSFSSWGMAGLRGNLTPYCDFQEALPSEDVISAVENLKGKNSRVIAADVAASSGVSLYQAHRDLTRLASITQSDMAVTCDGDLLYSFPSNIRAVLSAKSFKYKVQNKLQTKVYPVLFYAFRLSFGVALLTGLVPVLVTIAFILATLSDQSEEERLLKDISHGGGYRFGRFWRWGDIWPHDYSYHYQKVLRQNGPDRSDSLALEVYREFQRSMEYLFSYIFGDGDPNNGLEDQQIKLAAKVIRDNYGAVTAEQLAPFCINAPDPDTNGGPSTNESASALVNERYVLPIVWKLGGEPQVMDQGDVVYVFPDFQSIAVGQPKKNINLLGIERGSMYNPNIISLLVQALKGVGAKEKNMQFLQEREWKLTEAGLTANVLTGGLGMVNLAGALFVGFLLYSPDLMLPGVPIPRYLGKDKQLYLFFLTYAVLFNAIPLARIFLINRENEQIQKRNSIRRAWTTKIKTSKGRLHRKLKNAATYGIKMKQLWSKTSSNRDFVFDSKVDFMNLDVAKHEEELKKFDKLIKQ